MKKIRVFLGDSEKALKKLKENSIDSMVTDPPAGIAFMSKSWDSNKGSRDEWISWLESIMEEAYRVLKPGAHALVWSIPRTSHWTATALENVGFEIRDVVAHNFGTGFPKSLDVSKSIDKELGCIDKREFKSKNPADRPYTHKDGETSTGWQSPVRPDKTHAYSEEAKKYDGYGTALKPSREDWILVRVPLEKKNIAQNILEYGTGALNIDAGRIAPTKDYDRSAANSKGTINAHEGFEGKSFKIRERNAEYQSELGRWPTNTIFTHHPECKVIGTKKVGTGNPSYRPVDQNFNGVQDGYKRPNASMYINKKAGSLVNRGVETVDEYECHEQCPIHLLNEQAGIKRSGGYPKQRFSPKTKNAYGGFNKQKCPEGMGSSVGNVSRYFYCSKASKTDKGDYNKHPTVKSTELMEYLIKLVTPEGGVVLDPFMGSGSTGVASIRLGFKFIGIEKEKEYLDIAVRRLREENLRVEQDK